MASVYPGAFDAFSNPLPTDKRTNHAAQHGAVNDAVEAIQAVLGLSPQGGSGTVSARIGVVEGGVLSRVSGPGSSTDNALVRFDGTGGKTVQNSGITVDDSGNVSSNLTVSKASPSLILTAASGNALLDVRGPVATSRGLYGRTDGTLRWRVLLADTSAESGSNAGSNFSVSAYDDSGNFIAAPLSIIRATGKTTLGSVGATAGLELGTSGPRVMSGTGSPEGVVTAPVGSQWTDTAATAGAIRWTKASGAGSTGWVVDYGDTGLRNLGAQALLNGWTQSVFTLRRVGNLVEYNMWANSTSATADAVYTIPSGFRPAVDYARFTQATNNTDDYCRGYVEKSSGTLSILRGGVNAGAIVYVYGTYFTSDIWPATLPGTAA